MPYIHNGPSVYQTASGALVPGGHLDAAILVVANGGTLSDEDARRFGLVNATGDMINPDLLSTTEDVIEVKDDPKDDEDEKGLTPKPNKAKQPGQNK